MSWYNSGDCSRANQHIDSELVDLGWKDLIRLAEYHEKQATICRSRASMLEGYETMGKKVDKRLQFLWQLPDFTIKYVRRGHDLDTAFQKTADHTGVKFETVKHHWKRFLREKSKDQINKRNRLIAHLASIGLSNSEIGSRVFLHPNSVSRILGKMRRFSRIERPVDKNLMLFETIKKEIGKKKNAKNGDAGIQHRRS